MADGDKEGAGGKPHHYITSERQRAVRVGIILTGNSVAPFHTTSYESNARTFYFLPIFSAAQSCIFCPVSYYFQLTLWLLLVSDTFEGNHHVLLHGWKDFSMIAFL